MRAMPGGNLYFIC